MSICDESVGPMLDKHSDHLEAMAFASEMESSVLVVITLVVQVCIVGEE